MNTLPSQPRTRINQTQQKYLLRLIKVLFGFGNSTAEIKQIIAHEFQISHRSVERYFTRARREMIVHLKVAADQMRADSLFFYISMINNPKSKRREHIRARQRNLMRDQMKNISDAKRKAICQILMNQHRGQSPIQHNQSVS